MQCQRCIGSLYRAEGAFRSTTNRILGLEKSRFALIALVWLFESLDEVRNINFRPLQKNLVYVSVLKSPDFIFYERAHRGSGRARCISAVTFSKNPKIEILKMTVWFVLGS